MQHDGHNNVAPYCIVDCILECCCTPPAGVARLGGSAVLGSGGDASLDAFLGVGSTSSGGALPGAGTPHKTLGVEAIERMLFSAAPAATDLAAAVKKRKKKKPKAGMESAPNT